MYATEEQARILREAVAEIKKHPETFDMSQWARHSSTCGSVCCLAGQVVRNHSSPEQWVEWLHLQQLDQSGRPSAWAYPIRREAERLLMMHESLTERLFNHLDWPARFVTETVIAEDDCGYVDWTEEFLLPTVEQLEARVEHWIETGE